MLLSDSLEMVGVELKATWVQTRKANGDIIQTRVTNTVNAWKSGKFMDLSCRPWSLNSNALSKVWFKCHTVDLRVADHNCITSKVKSWLFQDQLEKPEEMILHRPIKMGGLGLHNVKIKALAALIRTFMETAANPSFNQNFYHSVLYRVYVLNDDSISNPPLLPPYYPASFFSLIKQVKDETPLNVTTMSLADWYRLLVEQEITMVEPNDGPREFIKCRAETASPDTDWGVSWRRARIKGLGSEATSFLWKLLHRLLPSEDRLARILPNSSLNCKLCPSPTKADLNHCFFLCVSTKEVGTILLNMFKQHDTSVTAEKLLRLEFECEDANEMPLVWIFAQTALYSWGVRASGKIVDKMMTRAILESKISLLRETRYSNEHLLSKNLIEQNW